MSSKLLHAIVGVGISLGAGGACMSSSDGLEEPVDGFCDTSWPVTKGEGTHIEFPKCLDPTGECRAYEPEVPCIARLGEYSCSGTIVAATCVDAEWQCPDGWRRARECPCYGLPPPGYECTADGLVKLGEGDAGAGGSASAPGGEGGSGSGEHGVAGAGG